ncbi:hypothetical protein RvY_01645 [Ramazzottius varieornatus]|uniref:Purkinje cell protein 4 n=1 Tax=Ramazzottius varieornatus TaxID=947166 RepID=A0A1D1UH33_RAMVA|nr:hypothetical protein RvY_01645 [Ramazzottius varieornatus]
MATSANAPVNTKTSVHDSTTTSAGATQAEDDVDIDLTDPDVEKAALKIQGAFKGLKSKKSSGATSKPSATNPEKP